MKLRFKRAFARVVSRLLHKRSPTIDFLIIGSAKCATTSFHHYLSRHPEIYLPLDCGINHETGFFLEPTNESIKGLTNRMIRKDVDRMFENYRRQRVVGERCTDYTKYPFRTVDFAAIKAHNPQMKFLYFVGEPVNRLKKLYRHNLRHHPGETAADFLAEMKRQSHFYEKVCSYYLQMIRYLHFFGTRNIRLVNVDAVENHTDETLAEIFRFLGVRNIRIKNSTQRFNLNDIARIETELRIPTAVQRRLEIDALRLKKVAGELGIYIGKRQ